MLKRIRAALRRVARGSRGTPKHRAHDPRDARRYRAGGDFDVAKGAVARSVSGGSQPPPGF
jgi:hypothetical protein